MRAANLSGVRTRLGVGVAALVVAVGSVIAAQGESPTMVGVPRPTVLTPTPEAFALPATLDPQPATTTTAPATLPAEVPPGVGAGAGAVVGGGPGAAVGGGQDPVPTGVSRPVAARRAPREATGFIEIPAIGLRHDTYEGIDIGTINKGPSHWPDTPLPGQRGNTVFPGHRTTYTRPFYDIDRLRRGDHVIFTNDLGRFVYEVTETFVVGPRDTWIVNQTPDATMTLFACHPKGSARQRYVAKGRLVSAPAALQPEPKPEPQSSPPPKRQQPPSSPPPTTSTTAPPRQNRDTIGALLG